MSEQKIGCVPDGYMPIPTAEQLADALDGVRCFHDMSAELIAPELLANLLAVTAVKAEQVKCTTCQDSGIVGHSDVCPECQDTWQPSPSLPAAGSAELIADAERCLFVMREIGSMDGDDITGDDVDLRFEDDEGRDTGCDVSIVEYAEKSADVIEKMIAALSAQQSAQHPDDAAVERFAAAMKAKLARCREKGRHGWQTASAAHLSSLLYHHMYKADPLDVANLAMMLHQNGQVIELPHDALLNGGEA